MYILCCLFLYLSVCLRLLIAVSVTPLSHRVFLAQFLTQSDEDRFIVEEPIMTADKVVIIMASKTHIERARQYGTGRAVILG
jgi:hypothetical protein